MTPAEIYTTLKRIEAKFDRLSKLIEESIKSDMAAAIELRNPAVDPTSNEARPNRQGTAG